MNLKIYFGNSTEEYITQLSGSNKNITYAIRKNNQIFIDYIFYQYLLDVLSNS